MKKSIELRHGRTCVFGLCHGVSKKSVHPTSDERVEIDFCKCMQFLVKGHLFRLFGNILKAGNYPQINSRGVIHLGRKRPSFLTSIG